MGREKQAELKDRLRVALDRRNMKPSELADKTGVPKSMISYYLAGKSIPRSDRIYDLAIALDVSEAWLMGFDVSSERDVKISQSDAKITEGESMLLELFRRVPEDQQELVLQMIRAALNASK